MMLLLAYWGSDSKITIKNSGGLVLGSETEGREEVSGPVSFRFLKYGQRQRGVRRGKEFDLCPGRGE